MAGEKLDPQAAGDIRCQPAKKSRPRVAKEPAAGIDDRNLFAGKVVPRGDGFDVFDGRGLYERTIRGR